MPLQGNKIEFEIRNLSYASGLTDYRLEIVLVMFWSSTVRWECHSGFETGNY